MRPATFEPQQIIEAGLALQAEGRNITGFALRNRVGGGNPGRLKQVWDEYLSSQTEVTAEPVAELPVEVAEEVKAVSSALVERISQLATELNDKAVRAAERRVAEVTRAAGEQTAQAERELADAAQTVDDLEEKLDGVTIELRKALEMLEASREREQERTISLTEVRERLAAAEKQNLDAEKAAELASEQHRKQVEDLQNRLAKLEQVQQAASDAREAKAAMTGELTALKAHNEQLATLLAGKTAPAATKTKK
jgi:chromosome segregation ATPase